MLAVNRADSQHGRWSIVREERDQNKKTDYYGRRSMESPSKKKKLGYLRKL